MNHSSVIGVLLTSHYLSTMVQEIIIGLIFITALGYIGNLIYKSFQARHACSTGCGKCGVVNLKAEKLEK